MLELNLGDRDAAKALLHPALHELDVRITNLAAGDCHCNLIAEVALDAITPVFAVAELRGYDRAVALLRDEATRIVGDITSGISPGVAASSTASAAVYRHVADWLAAHREAQP